MKVRLLPLFQVFVWLRKKLEVTYMVMWRLYGTLLPKFSDSYFSLKEPYEVEEQGKKKKKLFVCHHYHSKVVHLYL